MPPDQLLLPHAAKAPGGSPMVLSYGLGVDSTAILLRWLTDPASRDFPLSDLTVVTSMTGDEYPDTGRLVTEHVLPELRRHRVRFLQVARGGASQHDGIRILDDSRQPTKLFLAGGWRLQDELRINGTLPQRAHDRRLCSLKFKGWVIDELLARLFGSAPFRHIMGFNADEDTRIKRDRSYSTRQRTSEYPLLDWGWGRRECERYLEALVGERWKKSCCSYCPFQATLAGLAGMLERWRTFPDRAAEAAMLEHVALALNPNISLIDGVRVDQLLARDGNTHALELLARRLAACEWALYDVRRVVTARAGQPTRKGRTWRSVRRRATGERGPLERALHLHAARHQAQVTVDDNGTMRTLLLPRGPALPTREQMLVVAPAEVADKQLAGFERLWGSFLQGCLDGLELPAGPSVTGDNAAIR